MDIAGNSDNVVINGSLILIGGTNSVDVKMVSPNEKKSLPDIPVEVSGHCVTKLDEKTIMVAGGFVAGAYTKDTWVLDLQTETWSPSHPMITTRFNPMCTMFKIGDKAINVVAGGWDGYGRTDLVEYFDYQANSGWIQGQPMPMELNLANMVSYGQGALVIGGKDNGNEVRTEIHQLVCGFSLSDCKWKTLDQKLEYPRSRHVSMLIPDSLAKELCG